MLLAAFYEEDYKDSKRAHVLVLMPRNQKQLELAIKQYMQNKVLKLLALRLNVCR